jgi:mono/diheme cytochrome c family protein
MSVLTKSLGICVLASLPVVGLVLAAGKSTQQSAPSDIVARGKYLVNYGGCNDCHTPIKMGPQGPEPDVTRLLSGHPADANFPPPPKLGGPWFAATGAFTAWAGPWGISYAANLTPDETTGLGIWTEEIFINTMRTGKHYGVARDILPPMPWKALNTLNDEDLKAVFAYLRTIPPIKNRVPEPVMAGKDDKFE